MSPPNDERRPGEGGGSSDRLGSRSKDTPVGRPGTAWHAVAHADLVVGTRGRTRLVLVVGSCPMCHHAHSHNAAPDFLVGKRKAACGLGRYTVHVSYREGRWAA